MDRLGTEDPGIIRRGLEVRRPRAGQPSSLAPLLCQRPPVLGQGSWTDDLVSHEENGQQQKYLGVCQLPGQGGDTDD